jgi:hypothetical protein
LHSPRKHKDVDIAHKEAGNVVYRAIRIYEHATLPTLPRTWTLYLVLLYADLHQIFLQPHFSRAIVTLLKPYFINHGTCKACNCLILEYNINISQHSRVTNVKRGRMGTASARSSVTGKCKVLQSPAFTSSVQLFALGRRKGSVVQLFARRKKKSSVQSLAVAGHQKPNNQCSSGRRITMAIR